MRRFFFKVTLALLIFLFVSHARSAAVDEGCDQFFSGVPFYFKYMSNTGPAQFRMTLLSDGSGRQETPTTQGIYKFTWRRTPSGYCRTDLGRETCYEVRGFNGTCTQHIGTTLMGTLSVAQDVDLFAYCKAKGDLDDLPNVRPDPESERALLETFGNVDKLPGIAWRCMDSKVWACELAASGYTCQKMDPTTRPTKAMMDFCDKNPGVSLPMSVVGNSPYSWNCSGETPIPAGATPIPAGSAAPFLDKRSFLNDVWLEVHESAQLSALSSAYRDDETKGGENMTPISGAMVSVFIILTNVMLAVAALGMIALLLAIIFWFSPMFQERIMRGLAASCGLLIYVGARAVGLSVPDLIYKSLSTTVPISVGLLGVILPGAAGVILAWYVIRFLRSGDALHNIIAMRILSLIITLVFFLYCDAYVSAFGPKQENQFVYMLPNISFVLSILLYAIFKYHPLDTESDSLKWRG